MGCGSSVASGRCSGQRSISEEDQAALTSVVAKLTPEEAQVVMRIMSDPSTKDSVVNTVDAALKNRDVSPTVESSSIDANTVHESDAMLPDDQDFQALTGGRDPVRIPLVECRAVLPGQFDALIAYMRDKCDDEGVIKGWHTSNTFVQKQKLYLKEVNLYEVNTWIIVPLTARSQCSFVEAVTEDPSLQKPAWFVSHWWGTPVVKFVKCVKGHLGLRMLPESSTAYWVCAYCNNQHELGTEMGVDPMESSFLKALDASSGVVLVLDSDSTPFTRVWCIFEEGVLALATRGQLDVATSVASERAALKSLAKKDDTVLLDIGHVDNDGVTHFISDGLTDSDKQEKYWSTEWSKKVARESTFPLALIKECMTLNITEARATQEQDRVRILNALTGAKTAEELEKTPHAVHDAYLIVNQYVRSRLGIAGWINAIEAGCTSLDYPIIRQLREDKTRRKFAMPPLLGKSLAKLPNSQAVINDLADAIGQMTDLHLLQVQLGGCSAFTDVSRLASNLQHLSRMTTLMLNFERIGVVAFDVLWHAIAQLPLLVSFKFLAEGTQFNNIAELSHALPKWSKLKVLQVKLQDCKKLTSIAGLGTSLESIKDTLQDLDLNFINCTAFSESVHPLSVSLATLSNLGRLRLRFDGTGLTDISDFAANLGTIDHSINKVELAFVNCKGLPTAQQKVFGSMIDFLASAV
eukprot:TRINITY_DN71358_c0_g1_i1.p1 TRINITY_DN71358_c0_g1~~TRINITY_DN71358_c0_g1_i1.p1  ORF type:complete len:693 (+),score=89.78 TRINITY_DN71358_c0_g1_i1:58-2136(+)